MSRTVFAFRRAWRMFILERGRASLMRHNPTHPDLPLILLELLWWKETT